MQQLSFDGPVPPAPPMVERPTAKQLTEGTFLACADCGAYVHNANGSDGTVCPKCGKWATRHGARLAARYHYQIPLPIGVRDPLAHGRLVTSGPGPECNVTKGVSDWCAEPVPCWTNPESQCHMQTIELKEISILDPANYSPNFASIVPIYNAVATTVNGIYTRHHTAQVELFRTRKDRDIARAALAKSQEEMDSAMRDNHAVETELTKALEAFNQVKDQLTALGMKL